MKTNVQFDIFGVMLYLVDNGMVKNMSHIIQLLIILGKFHVHKSKWTGSKTLLSLFYCWSQTVWHLNQM